MPKGKTSPSKNLKKVVSKKVPEKVTDVEDAEEVSAILPIKEKVILEIEERDDVLAPVDKMVADPLREAAAVSIDGAEIEETGLDEEEVDPFGDKWEA